MSPRPVTTSWEVIISISPSLSTVTLPPTSTRLSPKRTCPSVTRVRESRLVRVVESSPRFITPVATASVPAVMVRSRPPKSTLPSLPGPTVTGLLPSVARSKITSPVLIKLNEEAVIVANQRSPMVVWSPTVVGASSPSTMVTVSGSSRKDPAFPSAALRSTSPCTFTP